jgi:restriction system protein
VAVPEFQAFLLPLLQLAADGNIHTLQEAYVAMAKHFHLSEEDQQTLLPSGKQVVYKNRVSWARSFLGKALLLESPKRGQFSLSERGKKLLAENPETLRVKHLMNYPEFKKFQTAKSGKNRKTGRNENVEERTTTPEEIFEAAFQELQSSLADELIQQITNNSPDFFERLVVNLLVKMGYGGSIKDAGQALGRSGDEGIDGIIKEDKLGLDIIYIQAKRWQGTVGRPEIQKFVGALHGQQAKKGVFITTSGFSKEAEQYASGIYPKVVLVDGNRLVELMIDYDLGVSTVDTYRIKRIDTDFFIEE